MRAVLSLCGGLLILATSVLTYRWPGVVGLQAIVGGAIAGAALHAGWWPVHTATQVREAMPVRGLSETIRELAPRLDAPEIVGGRAVVQGPSGLWGLSILDGVEIQIYHDFLTEPWPKVRALLATVLATHAFHRTLRLPSILLAAVLTLVILLTATSQGREGMMLATSIIFMLAMIAQSVGTFLLRSRVRRIGRRVLLTESDVEPYDEWMFPR